MSISHDRILAIKELRNRCDVTLGHAKDAIDQWMSVHPGGTPMDACNDLATVLPPAKPRAPSAVDIDALLDRIRVQEDAIRAALAIHDRYCDRVGATD